MSQRLLELQRMLDAANAGQRPAPAAPIEATNLDPRLHDYQVQAVRHLQANPRAALFFEMGLGKTAATLQALTPEHLPVLVIAPKRVAENVWAQEVKLWRPDLSIEIAAGVPAKRRKALSSGADIVAIGRDNIADIELDGRFRTVVLDELSGFKNYQTKRFKTARKLCHLTPYVWGLTGTPSPNGLMDLWAQLALLDEGQRLGKNITAYRRRYFYPGRQLHTGVVIEWKLRDGAAEAIQSAVGDICLSASTIDHLDLPPATVNPVRVTLPTGVQATYQRMAKTLVAELPDTDEVTAANAAAMTNKLQQITAGFLYSDDPAPERETHLLHAEKVKAVQEIVDGTGSPVLVLYQYQAEAERLRAEVEGAKMVDEVTVDDWNSGRVPVMLAHPASAGHGLNLQHGGHTAVWTTPTWNLEYWAQANKRLDRQGQQNPVIIHVLCAGPVDDAVLDRIEGKKTTQEALMTALKGRS